jgi:hypothetical protein
LIPPDLVNVFDERELELLIGGIADIDVDDWKKHTDYRGYTETDEVIVNFWKASTTKFSLQYLMLCADSSSVYPRLGCGTKVPLTSICYWYIPHSRKWFQGSSG